MGCRHPVGRTSANILKNVLQLICAGKDDSNADRTQVEQKSKVVQVPVKERILVIPFNLKRDAVLEAIDLVCRRVDPVSVNFDLFPPPTAIQDFLSLRS